MNIRLVLKKKIDYKMYVWKGENRVLFLILVSVGYLKIDYKFKI